MKISLKIDSNEARAKLRRWGGELSQRVRKNVAQSMSREVRGLRDDMRNHVAGQMKVVKSAFLKSFNARVLDRDPKRLPALHVSSRIPWAGIHERGGRISGRLLIPLHGRVGPKKFKAQVSALMRGGNAYFVKNAKGHIILMAENIREHDSVLSGFKRRYRKAEGVKRMKRGADVPIAVLVPGVTLKKRLDIVRIVTGKISRLAAGIDKSLRQLD